MRMLNLERGRQRGYVRGSGLLAWLGFFVAGMSSGVAAESTYKLPPLPVTEEHEISGKNAEVLGTSMYYLEEGSGDPVVFLHGNPTSSFLWRNVIPHVSGQWRAIAPDLVGMGRSGKPDIDYRFEDHYQYLSAFIDQLQLRDITFVVQDWGAALGFEYARRKPDRVIRIAFMEGVLPPIFPQPSFEAMGEELGGMFRAFKDPVKGRELVIEQNIFIEQLLPGFANRTLGQMATDEYRKPFLEFAHREPLLAWPREIPVAGEPKEAVALMANIATFMLETEMPMLLLYAEPGVLVSPQVADWYTQNVRNLESVFIGQGLHFVQEDQPFAIGRAVADWLRRAR